MVNFVSPYTNYTYSTLCGSPNPTCPMLSVLFTNSKGYKVNQSIFWLAWLVLDFVKFMFSMSKPFDHMRTDKRIDYNIELDWS